MIFPFNFSRSFFSVVAIVMSLLLSNIPATLLAASTEVASTQMTSTSDVVEEMARTEAQTRVEGFLQSQDVRSELAKRGLSADEVSSRLASLSASELRALSGQIDEARAGGNILYAILIVVLIIFLIQRI